MTNQYKCVCGADKFAVMPGTSSIICWACRRYYAVKESDDKMELIITPR
jgi:hypothetical protein